MPTRTRPIFPTALSIESAARSMQVPVRTIREAVYTFASLPAYSGSNNSVRILVRDLEMWVRTTWSRAIIKRKIERRRKT